MFVLLLNMGVRRRRGDSKRVEHTELQPRAETNKKGFLLYFFLQKKMSFRFRAKTPAQAPGNGSCCRQSSQSKTRGVLEAPSTVVKRGCG